MVFTVHLSFDDACGSLPLKQLQLTMRETESAKHNSQHATSFVRAVSVALISRMTPRRFNTAGANDEFRTETRVHTRVFDCQFNSVFVLSSSANFHRTFYSC